MLLLFSLATGCLTPLRLAEGASDAASISPEPTSWVCRPGTDGVCGAQPKAEWAPDGSLTRGTFTPDPSAPIDCFYVYPTVDLRIRTANADLGDTGPADRVTRAQAALLGEVCRVWAPRYRQVTLGTYFVGERRATPYFEIAWSDISRAFDEFLAEIGPDRGFVLYGHSQGGQQARRRRGSGAAAPSDRCPRARPRPTPGASWPSVASRRVVPPRDRPTPTPKVQHWPA
jgi:hypothetical protein